MSRSHGPNAVDASIPPRRLYHHRHLGFQPIVAAVVGADAGCRCRLRDRCWLPLCSHRRRTAAVVPEALNIWFVPLLPCSLTGGWWPFNFQSTFGVFGFEYTLACILGHSCTKLHSGMVGLLLL